jgi:HlyD family secretion protein
MIDFESPRARTVLAILTVGGLVTLWGCSNSPPAKSKEEPQAKKEEPKKSEDKKSTGRVIEQPALLEAYEETPLVARVAGYVKKIHLDSNKNPFDIDSPIKDKDVLAELWVPELEKDLAHKKALVKQAGAELKQAQASLQAAEFQVKTAKAVVDEAKAAENRVIANYDRWVSELARIKRLVKDNVVQDQILVETQNQFKSSEALVQEAKAKVRSAAALAEESAAKKVRADADVEVAAAHIAVAEAERDRVDALWEYRNIRAPYDGVVIKRKVHTGAQPAIGSNAEALFVVARTDKLRVVAEFPEAEAILIRSGMKAGVRIPALKKTFDATVSRTSWSLDNKNRTLRVEIDLVNNDRSLRPGLYGFVSLAESKP